MLIKKSIVTFFSTKYHSATITYCNKKIPDEGYPSGGCFDYTSFRSTYALTLLLQKKQGRRGCEGIRRKCCGSAENIFLRPPKLVHLKYTSQLQMVNLFHLGWRGVTLQRHLNEGTAG